MTLNFYSTTYNFSFSFDTEN